MCFCAHSKEVVYFRSLAFEKSQELGFGKVDLEVICHGKKELELEIIAKVQQKRSNGGKPFTAVLHFSREGSTMNYNEPDGALLATSSGHSLT